MTYEEMFVEIAQKYALDWRLLAEQAWTESRLDPLAMGRSSEMGLLQISPALWAEWSPRLGVKDPFDAYSNVLVGAAYLAFLRDFVDRFGVRGFYWVLLAYQWGPANVRRVLESGGQWLDVPASRRDYAISIVLRAELLAQVRSNPDSVTRPRRATVADDTTTLADLLYHPIPITETTPRSVQRRDR